MSKSNFKSLSIILLYTLLSFLLVRCNNEKKPKTYRAPQQNKVQQATYSFENPPKFRRDDNLSFIRRDDLSEILKIEIEVASTDKERERGLMYRANMEEHQGMLFLFSYETTQAFYMRNTIIPLDILYINSRMEIVDIYKNTKVKDETSLPSKHPAMYVVEVNAGVCDKYNIKEGDFIKF